APLTASLRQQAMAHYRAGRRREALQCCQQLLAIAPKQADVLALAGGIAMELRDVEQAVTYFEAAVATKRDFAEAHYNLGNALTELGRASQAVEAYRRAAKLRPDLAPIHNNLGNALQSLRRWGDAAQAYRRALALDPDSALLHRNLGIVLQAAGHPEDALAAYRRAAALKPDWPLAYSNLVNLLIERGAFSAAVETCDAWLAACPGSVEAIGLKSVALDEIGDRAGARALVDLDRFVRVIQFDTPPAGYASMAAFNAALTEHALTHPTLTLPPADDPRYHCPTLRITGEFLAEPKGPAAALEAMMNKAVADYLADFAGAEDTHPFLAKPPRAWRLTSWAAVLDRQGNLMPHVHYDVYVSGVYYCQLPHIVGAMDQGQAGWFELGRPPDHFRYAAAPETRAIQPRPGLMILFPSYFYHRTVPFEAAETRISIAFDAAPQA
ncbi:MAG TPA: tetratricopeptide repeat protein, partial [Stellaceae bacterium]|nr:tetratricopeptide repeat protein [Stellaceae bacterium]